jgi:hypothetical protein
MEKRSGERQPCKRIQKKLLKRLVRQREGFKSLGDCFVQDLDCEMTKRPSLSTMIFGSEEAVLLSLIAPTHGLELAGKERPILVKLLCHIKRERI